MKNLTNLGENIVKKFMRKISPTNLGENVVKNFLIKISPKILEKNIVNKSARTSAADS